MRHLTPKLAVQMYLAFASAYFFSALVRAVTAILSPTLTKELALNASDLGLLSGSLFLGFALMQLPLGNWLDRFGPRRVQLTLLSIAGVGCLVFSQAETFTGLFWARVLTGIGVSACLMAALTSYRRWLSVDLQLRLNSWMLMAASSGLIASTLPIEWLVPLLGWRMLFVWLTVLVLLCMLLISRWVPNTWEQAAPAGAGPATPAPGLAQVWANPYFRRMAPLGFFNYGGLLAIQTLWAGPWMVKVTGMSGAASAQGLFWINVVLLFTFLGWGAINPRLSKRGIRANELVTWGVPLTLLCFGLICWVGGDAPWWSLAIFLVLNTSVSNVPPAVGQAFSPAMAGRAMTTFNFLIFSGIFVVQWGMGLMIEGFKRLWGDEALAFQASFGIFGLCCLAAYLHFLWARPVVTSEPPKAAAA
jgi:MFS family permease